MNKVVLTDAGFWMALYEPRDQHYRAAQAIADQINNQQIILPWPVVYEFINTRFIRRKDRIDAFTAQLNKSNLRLLPDEEYRSVALDLSLRFGMYSLTDSVVRNILSDINVRVDYFVTFNPSDFEDVCYRRGIELLSNDIQ